jgi:internalin A
LELKAQGREPVGLLREIRKAIREQRIGEEPEERLTLDGITVARSTLSTVIEGRVPDIHGKPVPAASFVAFFEDREHDLRDDPSDGKLPGINIIPLSLTANEKPPEVFISYAWGDETPEGKIRAEVVDSLYSALKEGGFVPIRDRTHMRSGELISAFMRRLTRADLVVAVISDKYLRSPYCMYEIYKLWQKSQGDADLMAQCVKPIILPEVKIGDLAERAPYLKFWSDRKADFEVLRRDYLDSLSPASIEEVRLVQEFAHHIDEILRFLKDVLMPRNLEVHFDDGFEAVREALRPMGGEHLEESARRR